MKIERLIQIFEQLLPIYEKGYREKYSYVDIRINDIEWGICSAAFFNGLIDDWHEIRNVFKDGYYDSLLDKDHFLFPKPDTYKDLKPRIDFMKSEIKSLKKLLKQGYTHV